MVSRQLIGSDHKITFEMQEEMAKWDRSELGGGQVREKHKGNRTKLVSLKRGLK